MKTFEEIADEQLPEVTAVVAGVFFTTNSMVGCQIRGQDQEREVSLDRSAKLHDIGVRAIEALSPPPSKE